MPLSNQNGWSLNQNLTQINTTLARTNASINTIGGQIIGITAGINNIKNTLTNSFQSIKNIFTNSSTQLQSSPLNYYLVNTNYNLAMYQNDQNLSSVLFNSPYYDTTNPNTDDGSLIDILKSNGKTKIDNNNRYKIFIKFQGSDENLYDDVLSFVVYRMGFIKSAPIYHLKINLTPVIIEQMRFEHNNNNIIRLTLFIYTVDVEKNDELKNLILERDFIVTAFNPSTNTSIERGNIVMCDLVLINPILYQMDITFSFNKIFNSQSPYEVLQNYENYVLSTYGNGFETKHILNKKNDFKYQQIIIHPTDQDVRLPNRNMFTFFCRHDIDVPLYLNYKYKIDNTFGFYFYDDFNMMSKKDIVRYFLTFYDKNKFPKFKIEKYIDIMEQTQYTKSYAFADIEKMLMQENVVLTSKKINSEYTTKKTQKSQAGKVNTQSNNKISIINNSNERYLVSKKSSLTGQTKAPSSNYQTYQIPDNDVVASQRLDLAKKNLKEKIDRIDEFATPNCSFDWLQFGQLYNLNKSKPNSFVYTPISIVNMFHRIDSQSNVLGHIVRFMMIKFKEDENQNNTSSKSYDLLSPNISLSKSNDETTKTNRPKS